MHIYTLSQSQEVPGTLDEIFPFFSTPENLEDLTPPNLRFRILTPRPIAMHQGAIIDYLIRSRGISWRWTTAVVEFEAPHRFVDTQIQGPYAFWHHTHSFEPCPGGVRIHDEVRYGMRYGAFGELAHYCFVGTDLQHIFDYRRKRIARRFGTLKGSGPARAPRLRLAQT